MTKVSHRFFNVRLKSSIVVYFVLVSTLGYCAARFIVWNWHILEGNNGPVVGIVPVAPNCGSVGPGLDLLKDSLNTNNYVACSDRHVDSSLFTVLGARTILLFSFFTTCTASILLFLQAYTSLLSCYVTTSDI